MVLKINDIVAGNGRDRFMMAKIIAIDTVNEQ